MSKSRRSVPLQIVVSRYFAVILCEIIKFTAITYDMISIYVHSDTNFFFFEQIDEKLIENL